MIRPKVIKVFFILNSNEHEIDHALNVKIPRIVEILTFISMIKTTSVGLNPK